MKKHILKAEKRTITGKKVKNLRKQGLLPANIYGKVVKSQAVQIDLKEFTKVFSEAGESGLVELSLGEETRPILIHEVHYSPLTDLPIHADLYQVNLKEKVTSHVPVHVVGGAEAVSGKIGVLLTLIDEVEVEALPTDLPEHFELDVTPLKEVNQELKVKDLKIDKSKVEIKSDPDQTLVRIGPLVTEEMKKEAAAEEAAKATAAAQAAPPVEEAAPAEGIKPAETGKPEDKKPETKEPTKKEEGKKE